MSQPKKPQDDPAQSQRFLDIAEEVQVDDNPQVFERTLGAVAQTSPSISPQTKTSPRSKLDSRRTSAKP